jgi:KUP system potassium uptake protein
MDGKQLSNNPRGLSLSVAALGVVYGDIGTSPLYAFRETLHGLPITSLNVLGILSLIFWSLILVISVKYLCFIIRANNDGEGGILALLALLKRDSKKYYSILLVVGCLGAGLLMGDGMLTPAISVLSAVEGLHVISPSFSYAVLPLTVVILIGLFSFQRHGTGRIGSYFGPILLLWFSIIAILGCMRISQNPTILAAVNPQYAFHFFMHNGWKGYVLLGGVFLVITGGEALYADLGHFGKLPIRLSWFFVALPALLLNYFGQGAYLLQFPAAIENPFYMMAPPFLITPLIILATMATIIASQAVISATFSLANQAILLDLFPRLCIIQTSASHKGQLFVPQMNVILAIGTLMLVFIFKNSSALAHAYGIAVNLEMFLVTILVMTVARVYWNWSLLKVLSVFSLFVFIDLAFMGANSLKIISGGWLPLLFAIICAIIMMTWHAGITFLRTTYYKEKTNLTDIIEQLPHQELNYLPSTTSIFITDLYDNSGGVLLNYLKINRILPEHVLLVSIKVMTHPFVSNVDRFELMKLGKGIDRLILRYGFMDVINIQESLDNEVCERIFSFPLNIGKATFLLETPYIIATRREATLFFFWQEKLFAFLMRNGVADIEFFQLPYDRTIAIGTYCEI